MVADVPKKRRTVTIEEWATEVGVSRWAAYNAARRGEIPGLIRVGGRYLISRAAMDRLLDGQK